MINEEEYNSNIARLTGEISTLQGYLAKSASLHSCKNSVWSSPCGNFGSASYCDQKTNFPGMEPGEGQKFVARVKENHQQWLQCINGKISQAKQNLFDYQAQVQREELQRQVDVIAAEIRANEAARQAQILEVNPVVTEQVILTHGIQDIESPGIATRQTTSPELAGVAERRQIPQNNMLTVAAITAALFIGLPLLQRAL